MSRRKAGDPGELLGPRAPHSIVCGGRSSGTAVPVFVLPDSWALAQLGKLPEKMHSSCRIYLSNSAVFKT